MTDATDNFCPGRISIIMPCYNAEAFVQDALSSAFDQSYSDIEVIVIDDGSSDRSLEIVRGIGKPVVVLEQEHLGAYPARNAGLRAAKGEFVAFLDADDYWDTDCLKKLHAALVEHHADLAYCGWRNVGQGPRRGHSHVPVDYFAEDAVVAFLSSCPWPIHAALVRRSVVKDVGGFSVRRFTAMDYDLWIRLLAKSCKMVRIPEVLAFYRWHDKGQLSSIQWRQVLDARSVKRDFVAANPDLVRHVLGARLRKLVDDPVLSAAYETYWRRDLASAQRLFLEAMRIAAIRPRDLKYLLLSLLPRRLFHAAVRYIDRRKNLRGSRG